MILLNPIEQFRVIGHGLNNVDCVLILIVLSIYFFSKNEKNKFFNNQYLSLPLKIIIMISIWNLKTSNRKLRVLFPFFFLLQFFLLCINLVGLIPQVYTPTVNIIITVQLSFISFGSVLALAFDCHRENFWAFFMPVGANFLLAFFVVPLELFSYLFRILSLALRLSANVITGHVLLHVFCTFFAKFILLSNIYIKIISFSLILLVLFFILVEAAFGTLQAFLFIRLIYIYYEEII